MLFLVRDSKNLKIAKQELTPKFNNSNDFAAHLHTETSTSGDSAMIEASSLSRSPTAMSLNQQHGSSAKAAAVTVKISNTENTNKGLILYAQYSIGSSAWQPCIILLTVH